MATISRRFKKELLPDAKNFFERELGRLSRPNSRGECVARCCFHKDKHPSLSANVHTGQWFCHACGFGGDLVAFTMRRYSLSFKEACLRLNAWDGDAPRRRSRTKPALPERPQFLQPHERLAQLEAAFDAAVRRLDELHAEGRDESPVAEACWAIMARIYPKLRELRGDE